MLIGYARVSTIDQNPALQLDALQAAGVERLYADRASGLIEQRPKLQRALDAFRRGDPLVCWRLDRLGRSVAHLLLAEELRNRGVELRSLTEGIDTSTPAGEADMTIIAAMAPMERRLLSERTRAGVAAARRREGRWGPAGLWVAGKYRQAVGRGQLDGPLAVTSEVLGLELRFEENRLRLWDPVEGAYQLEPHEQAARQAQAAARRPAARRKAETAQRIAEAQAVAKAQARRESEERAAAEALARREADERNQQSEARAVAEAKAQQESEMRIQELQAQLATLKAEHAAQDQGSHSQDSADH